MRRLLALGLCAAFLVACGGGSPETLRSDPSPQPVPSGTLDREQACPSGEPVHLPADPGTIRAAYVCGSDYRSVPGEGDWSFDVVREVTGGLQELLDVYATADAERTSGACTLELPDPLVVYLHRDSGVLAVRAPRDPCSKPTAEARAAREALRTVVVSETKAGQGRSQLSVDTGCSDDYKDMLWLEEQHGSRTPPSGTPTPLGSGIRVCRYDVKADKDGFRVGHLTSGERLSAEVLARVNEELAKSRLDPGCSRSEHTRFANLSGDVDHWTQVALDGCALMQGGSWWRGTDRLRQLLTR